jgi:large subunit ribosomal protein L15
MYIHDLKPVKGANKSRKRLGRGTGSGLGTTAGKGTKGQKSRTGSKAYPWYEGGQVPLTRRLPKRGFTNAKFRREYEVVNIEGIEEKYEDGEVVDFSTLKGKKLIKGKYKNIKVLGLGELTKKLKFRVDKISEGARKKIEISGSTVALLSYGERSNEKK